MIVKNIEKLCKDAKISVSALERKLGFGNSTIAKWAISSPTIEKLSAVANFFGVTVDSIIKDAESGDTCVP